MFIFAAPQLKAEMTLTLSEEDQHTRSAKLARIFDRAAWPQRDMKKRLQPNEAREGVSIFAVPQCDVYSDSTYNGYHREVVWLLARLLFVTTFAVGGDTCDCRNLLEAFVVAGGLCGCMRLLWLLATSVDVGCFCRWWRLLGLLATSVVADDFCGCWRLLWLLALWARVQVQRRCGDNAIVIESSALCISTLRLAPPYHSNDSLIL